MKLQKGLDPARPDIFYPSILESIAEGIVVIGLDRKILFINKMARSLIGNQAGIEGLRCNEVMSTDLCSEGCPLDSDNKISSCGQASYFMNINLHKKDLPPIPLCLNVAPLHDEKGDMIGIIENFRPMSEAIKVIESLEKSNVVLAQEKNKIASIINSLADGVFTVDREMHITSFNKGMEELTGLNESDVIGRLCGEVFNADNCTENCPISHALKNGYGTANIMERLVGKDGRIIPVFMSTAFLRDGAEDAGLIATVRDATEIEKLKKEVNNRNSFSNIIGKSKPLQQIFELIEAVSETDCAVLIEGESGTGKELVARAIHHESERRNKNFVTVNCSAIVEGLFESELFGHVKGAFTGAIKDKAGKFELADGGTMFLDEIGEMPMALQAKLLRVIQGMEFERVGGNETKKVDVRVIAATNKELQHEIKACNFREDLYYRLCIVPIKMPPLRERKEDIPLLVKHFLKKSTLRNPKRPRIIDVDPAALSMLIDYDWPGNIRELQNAIEHACIRSKTNDIDIEALPPSIKDGIVRKTVEVDSGIGAKNLQEREIQEIRELLIKYNGNKSRVAKDLGLSRTTLWRRFKKHNLLETE